VLPAGTLIEVHYEALVADQAAQSRALVEACGLPWDPACLEFHASRRPVATISAAAVRRPIYTESVALWRHYEAHLQPLMAALAGHDEA
jgi:hypothetical protein